MPKTENHLHPFAHVIKFIQMEKGVLQSGDGAVGVQEATHVELVAVSFVPRARGTTNQGQRLSLELARQHGGSGAGTRLRLICSTCTRTTVNTAHSPLSSVTCHCVHCVTSLSGNLIPSRDQKQWQIVNYKQRERGVTSMQSDTCCFHSVNTFLLSAGHTGVWLPGCWQHMWHFSFMESPGQSHCCRRCFTHTDSAQTCTDRQKDCS